jgi:DHA1 family bicyclomycin/chloramphenicol resistance-like MFS transporter
MTADRPVHSVRLAALLALLAMFGPFAIDAFFPAFHAVAQDLGASDWAMQQTISVYLLAYSLMSLVHGPLSDAMGRRVVILAGVLMYTVASVWCALAGSIGELLAARALQGVSTGAGLIVGRAIVRDLYHGPEAQKVMALITLFFGVAPAIAPVIGGLVYQAADWRAVFWFLAAYGVALYVLCWRSLPETHPPRARMPLKLAPLARVYGTQVRDLRFVLLAIATGFNFGASFLYISSAPAFIERILGLGTLGYPWFFVPMIVGMMTGATLSNRLAGRLSPRRTVQTGYAIMAVAGALNLGYNALATTPSVPWAVLPMGLNAVGIALSFPTLSIKMLDRYPHNRGAASSMQAFLWGMVTSTIAGVLSAMLSGSAWHLALGAATLSALGWLCWRGYAAITPVPAEPLGDLPDDGPQAPAPT